MTTDSTALICPWCNKPVLAYEPQVPMDGDTFHLDCAAQDMDNASWDIDMGSSS